MLQIEASLDDLETNTQSFPKGRSMANTHFCPVCHSTMSMGREIWHRECQQCGYEKSELEPAINEECAHQKIDERFREEGLRSLRIENFEILLNSISYSVPAGHLLDVGCAHGWFLEAAQSRGFDAMGIEPDENVCDGTVARGLNVKRGFFPDVLAESEKFDVIVFNDVFEHIPNVISVLEGCRNHLAPGGILVLNLPSSAGFFYKTSKLISRLGASGFFERLWQKGFPSPHLHYFNSENLSKLLSTNGFDPVSSGCLASVRLKGLYTRITYDRKYIRPIRLFTFLLVVMALPLIKLAPDDIIFLIAKKK